MSGYALAPASSFADLSSLSTLAALTAGTCLCIASANAINQLVEVPYDAQMARTRGRVLVRRLLSPAHAGGFALTTGVLGTGILAAFTNPLTAALGAGNIVLYAGIYTSLKRITPFNTHVGSLVGAIPPLMGWTAATNAIGDWRAWIVPAILYIWQFPHFNSLSSSLASSYAQAGYRMYACLSPRKNKAMALRYALLLFPLCSYAAPAVGIVTWSFALWSAIPNAALAGCALRWWMWSEEKWARYTFWASLVHLAVLLGLMLAFKESGERVESLELEGRRLLEGKKKAW
ncbi:protoheme IX farnesyltransferase [Atractiella rhizophila]|nr:protoheme IX farnesyltransferase [Atractiella rhizophila]